MKKKIVVCIVILSMVGIFNLTKEVKADPVFFQVHYLNTDKEVYYNDETIYINASWDANPIPMLEEIYIRIEIWDTSDNILWYSTWDDSIGDDLIGEWNVDIDDLNLPVNESTNNLFVRFHFLYVYDTGFYDSFPTTKGIQTIKRNITCEMIDFDPNIKYGDNFHFKARFFFSENNINLSTYLITVKIVSMSSILYEENFTTDSNGIIEVNMTDSNNLTIGNLVLLLELIGNFYFNDSNFEFQLLIESNINESLDSTSSNSEDKKNNYVNNISIIVSLLGISFFAILFVYHNNIKKSKSKNLTDLTVKY